MSTMPTWRWVVTFLCVALLPRLARAEDDHRPALPSGVTDALRKMVDAQRSGDLDRYAETLASPVGPVFRLHIDSAVAVGRAKGRLQQLLISKFGSPPTKDPFAYAFDEEQMRSILRRLVNIDIDRAEPSGNNWKLQVSTTVAIANGGRRTIPQGFIAIQTGADWKLQDLAIVAKLAAQKKGAETNWAIFRAFNTIADAVAAGQFHGWDEPLARARAEYDQLTGANATPPAGREEYLAAEKLYNAGDFAGSLALFKLSADRGYPHAACMVAIQYSDGLGTKANLAAAVQYFRRDIAIHDATAENFLGSLLLEGDGVPKDSAEGMRLLRLAAEQDNASAFLNIGRAYLFGLGVPKDPSVGMQWYTRAADMGNEQAAYFVKWLAQSPGNRSFKDERQAAAFQQISVLRSLALLAAQGGYREDGTWRASDARRAIDLNAQADQLARDNGLD